MIRRTNLTMRLVFCVSVIVMLCPIAGADVIYVDVNTPDNNDGSSWAKAYKYLQDALAVAGDGNDIWVAEGRYKPDQGDGQTPGDREATFQLISGVGIYGSFPSGGGTWQQRDANAYETILSGDLLGNDGPNFANNTENSYHVITGADNATLDGFTITAGNANEGWDVHGGGMYNDSASPTITNCIFSANWALWGAGINNDSSSPTIANCTFSDNEADEDGGGMLNRLSSSPIVTNCTFTGNSAINHGGGGMSNQAFCTPTVTNCTFSGNFAEGKGGGMQNFNESSPVVTNCTFNDNDSNSTAGGGMYNVTFSYPTLINCILWGNTDSGGSDEHAQIYSAGNSTPVVEYSCIQGWTGSLGGAGNSGSDPNFDDSAGRLKPSSLCINTGDSTAVPVGVTTDLDGNTRIICDIVDKGAYEYQSLVNRMLTVSSTSGGKVTEPNEDEGPFMYSACGTVVDINATADANFTFVEWTGTAVDDGRVADSNSASTNVTIYTNYTLVAIFEGQRILTVSSTSGGKVTEPNEDESPFPYDYGTDANLVAAPLANYHFVEWTGDISTIADPCAATTTIMMDANYAVIANFAIDQRSLTTATTTGGTVTDPGIGTYPYDHGTDANLIAAPLANYHFVEWTGDISTIDDPCAATTTITMDANYAVLANFVLRPPAFLYVDADAKGHSDGTGWSDAFNHLQDALAIAIDNDQILVAQGTYYPDANSSYPDGSGDQNSTFQLIKNVAIYGGFAGDGQPIPHKRSIQLYKTIVSGDINTPGDANDNSYHVVTGSGTDANAVLDGFTITAGNANGTGNDQFGGGMYISQGSPTVTNCTFSGNVADSDGGGMYNINDSSPGIINCTFTGNVAANNGGGIYNEESTPIITNCTLSGNIAEGTGGGMYNNQGSPAVTNCTFSGNTASPGGGGMHDYYGNPTLTNCTFSGNTADSNGGGMFNTGSSEVTVSNCIFWDNSASDGNEIALANSATIDVNYCDVEGGQADVCDDGTGTVNWGPGNINVDPMFFDSNNLDLNLRDYHLIPGSPCIDAGDNNSVPADTIDLDGDGNTTEQIPFDIDDDPRFDDGDSNGTAIVDMGSDEVIWDGATNIAPADPPVTLNPGGGTNDPNIEALVVFDNNSAGDANITVVEMSSDPHPQSGGFGGLGTTLRIDTSLANGEFFMTVTVPFDANDLGDDDPCNVDLMYYDDSGNWVLAVAGNDQNSPSKDGPVGAPWREIYPPNSPPSLDTLANRPLGDYGVFWNSVTKEGFVWANVDHSTDFGGVVWLRGDIEPDGDVDFVDFAFFAAWWQETGCGICGRADLTVEGNVDWADLEEFTDNWLFGK